MVIVLSVACVVGAMLYFNLSGPDLDEQATFVRGEVRRFEQEVKIRAATEYGTQTGRNWPMTIDPGWFKVPPQNTLVSNDRPWVEIAPPEHADLTDPVARLTMDRTLASFWYNPYQGVIRARVPLGANDEEALALYNRVNATRLTTLYAAPPKPIEPEFSEIEAEQLSEGDPENDPENNQTHTENNTGDEGVEVSGVPGG
ncbi:hypothetical protein JYU07_00420 [Roseiflexus sp. AH-315-K22]|nr:hypothetical protein [Roseiflexus sp. AH-315-K22]